MRIHLNDRYPPNDHQPESLVVIPLGPMSTNREVRLPFASIIALNKGEDISAKPRLCINVEESDGQWLLGDGIFACKSECPMILLPTPFPELAKALRLVRSEWSTLLKTPKDTKPYTAIKNWLEGDMEVEHYSNEGAHNWMTEEQFGPLVAFRLLAKWGELQKQNWRDRLYRTVSGSEKLSGGLIDAMVFRLQKLCKAIGLASRSRSDFKENFSDLNRALLIAHKVSEDLKAESEKGSVK